MATKTICLHCKKRNICFLQNIQTRSTTTGALPQPPIILPGTHRTSLLFTNINKHQFTSVIQGWFYRTFEIYLYRVAQKSLDIRCLLHVASSNIRVLGHSVDTAWRLLLRRVSESSQNMGQRLHCCDTVGFTLRNSTFWVEEEFRKYLLYIPNSSRLSSSRRPDNEEFHKKKIAILQ